MNRIRKSRFVFVLLVAFIGFDAALMLTGCERRPPVVAPNTVQFGDKTLTAPPGSTITIDSDAEQYQGEGIEKQEGSASGEGSGMTTSSEKAALQHNSSAPGAWLPGIGATGGTTDVRATLTGSTPTSPLLWAGILAAIGGGVAFYFGLRRAAFVCFGLAGALIAASFIPAWAWIILALAAAAVVAFYVYAERSGKSMKEAVRGIASGLEAAPDEARRAVKASIALHTDEADKKTIRAVKRADDLPAERA